MHKSESSSIQDTKKKSGKSFSGETARLPKGQKGLMKLRKKIKSSSIDIALSSPKRLEGIEPLEDPLSPRPRSTSASSLAQFEEHLKALEQATNSNELVDNVYAILQGIKFY